MLATGSICRSARVLRYKEVEPAGGVVLNAIFMRLLRREARMFSDTGVDSLADAREEVVESHAT
jgi:hypothetical protein